ncbi:MAG: hypothetical protein ABI162_08410 [Luteolibacter sp.]
MSRDIHITRRQIIYLTYPEAGFPGWKPGHMLTDRLVAPDGTVYHFTGAATVEGVVHNAGHHYDVQITHVPRWAGEA